MWSYPPHRILAPTDFGQASSHAIRLAGRLARTFDSSLTVLHADSLEAPPYFTTEQVRVVERQRRRARSDAVRHLSRFAVPLAGLEPEVRITDGPAAISIIDATLEHDLVVMGTHGRRGAARWWAGSVAERVVRESKVPVLVVRAHPAGDSVFKRITVLAGTGAFDGPARRYAKGLASTFEGELSRETARTLERATLDEATLVVVARRSSERTSLFTSASADALVRNCRRPILFVPGI